MDISIDDIAKLLGVKLSKARRQQIEKNLSESKKRWDAEAAPLLKAIHDSERLTAADYSIRINC